MRRTCLLFGLSIAAMVLPQAAAGEIQPSPPFSDCPETDHCPTMVIVPGGDFRMGSPDTESGRYPDEGPQRSVRVQSFAIGVQEVTFDQWRACVVGGGCRENPDPDNNGWGRGAQPVINVSWLDAQAYVGWLGRRTGLNYRLPTEAEWEYAARGGSEGPFPWGTAAPTCDRPALTSANFRGCGLGRAAPVGSFGGVSEFGLQDALGNVWEWVQDCYSVSGLPVDGSAFEGADCPLRVTRGGSWDVTPRDLRLANRFKIEPVFRSPHLGFRVARDLP